MGAMTAAEDLNRALAISTQLQLLDAATAELEFAGQLVPTAPARFHWSGDARERYRVDLDSLRVALDRAVIAVRDARSEIEAGVRVG